MAIKFAKRMEVLKASEIRELLKLTERPEVISFAGGLPAPELFPVEEMKEISKIVLNEFVAFSSLSPLVGTLSAKATAIATFSLCGFANISSIAILIGGIGGMAPSRKGDIARLGWKAIIAGTLANLLSATIAGFLLTM